ncbi:hypothetical protein JET68_05215 [Pseudomonas monteilii]|uniref:hypothetical protein n=1 Tax=Pseudomonas putida group TaxID=136845 RepID=UPI0018659916|nr:MULTISPECIES: hypothetical protein [Pseudomonas putida group]MBI6918192.1 hypothetical protein [Pseudomonas monteilii]
MNTDPRDLFVSLNPLGLDERELMKDRTGFADMRTHGDYLVFLAGYKAGTVDGEKRMCQGHRPMNTEGCKPEISIRPTGCPTSDLAPEHSLDKTEGCKPDNNIRPAKQFRAEPTLWRFRANPSRPWNTTENEGVVAHARGHRFEVQEFYTHANPAEVTSRQSNCVKCSVPHQAAHAPKATPAALMLAMENLAVKAVAADHPPIFPPTSVRQVPLVMLGGICLRVSYSGLKWYHDQLIDDRWEPLSVDEFEALLTEALRGSTPGSNP